MERPRTIFNSLSRLQHDLPHRLARFHQIVGARRFGQRNRCGNRGLHASRQQVDPGTDRLGVLAAGIEQPVFDPAKFADLKALSGQRIAIGIKDSDNAVTARFLLRAAGISDKKTKLVTGDARLSILILVLFFVGGMLLLSRVPAPKT